MKVDLDTPKTFRLVLDPADLDLLRKGIQLIAKSSGVFFVVELEEEKNEE